MCLPSPRLRRVFSLSSALVTEELYLQAGTEAEALSFADIDKPGGSGGEGLSVDTFRHEENAIGGDFGEFQQERFNFDQIVFG